VAVTITLNAGSHRPGIPGTGILSHEMDDFAIKPVSDIYKLVGAEANSVAPGSVRCRA